MNNNNNVINMDNNQRYWREERLHMTTEEIEQDNLQFMAFQFEQRDVYDRFIDSLEQVDTNVQPSISNTLRECDPEPTKTYSYCLSNDTDCRTLECDHTFHLKCISKWATDKATCPMCRAPLSATIQID